MKDVWNCAFCGDGMNWKTPLCKEHQFRFQESGSEFGTHMIACSTCAEKHRLGNRWIEVQF